MVVDGAGPGSSSSGCSASCSAWGTPLLAAYFVALYIGLGNLKCLVCVAKLTHTHQHTHDVVVANVIGFFGFAVA